MHPTVRPRYSSPSHPDAVTLCQIIVDRDEVHPPTGKRVKVHRHLSPRASSLHRGHLSNLRLMEHHAADELDVERDHVPKGRAFPEKIERSPHQPRQASLTAANAPEEAPRASDVISSLSFSRAAISSMTLPARRVRVLLQLARFTTSASSVSFSASCMRARNSPVLARSSSSESLPYSSYRTLISSRRDGEP